MPKDELIISQIKEIKSSISDFMVTINEYCEKNDLPICNQARTDFFSFVSKQIVFLRNMYEYCPSNHNYHVKVLISDFYNLILCLLKNEHRYIYLNERSIIENYVRWIVNIDIETDHITNNVLEIFKNKQYYKSLTTDEYALIKNEYTTSCGYIHGSKLLDYNLSCVFNDCISSFYLFENINHYYSRMSRIVKIFNRLLISTYPDDITSAFHRRKSVLEYLIGKNMVDDLFLLENK